MKAIQAYAVLISTARSVKLIQPEAYCLIQRYWLLLSEKPISAFPLYPQALISAAPSLDRDINGVKGLTK